MKEYDLVEVTVEKDKYACEGVHKGMQGTILDPRNIDGCWLVYFADPVTGADTIGIPIKEKDLKLIYESPLPQEGNKVRLMVYDEQYAKHGIQKGMYGVISRASDNENYQIVKFELSDGTDKEIAVYYDDLIIINNE